MNNNDSDTFQSWINDLSSFYQNDPLVNLSKSLHLDWQDEYQLSSNTFKKIISISQESIKIYGTNPISCAFGNVIKIGERELNAPFKIANVSVEINKVKQIATLEIEEDSVQINPYLLDLLHNQYQIETKEIDFENEIELFEKHGIVIENKEKKWIGLFNPNRYKLRNELLEIQKEKVLSQPLYEQIKLINIPRKENLFTEYDLLFLDNDQRQIISNLATKNSIVEGPPGTGKSQLLIDLIGKQLTSQKSTLIFSEKKTALDVLHKRLKELELDSFTFTINDTIPLREIYESLSNQWQLIENFIPKNISEPLRPNFEQNMQFKIDIWNQDNLIGQGSWKLFKELSRNIDYTKGRNLILAPDTEIIFKNKTLLQNIYKQNIDQICYWIFKQFKQKSFEKLIEDINNIKLKNSKIEDGKLTIKELDKLQLFQINTQLFNSKFALENREVLQPDSKKRLEIIKWIERFLRTIYKEDLSKEENSHWKRNVSLEELKYIQATYLKSGFFERLKFNRIWRKVSLATPKIAEDLIITEIVNKNNSKDRQKIQEKLSEYSIETKEDAIIFKNQLAAFTDIQWEIHQKIKLEDFINVEKIDFQISDLKQLLKEYNFKENIPLQEQIEQVLSQSQHLSIIWKECSKLPTAFFTALKYSSTFEEYTTNCLHTHWLNFRAMYPSLAEIENEGFNTFIDQFIQQIKDEQKYVIQTIWVGAKNKMKEYHEILAQVNNKKNEKNKELRQRLKKGKAILIKEFNKKQQHLSIRNLLNSDAKLWIEVLQPIHFSNPIQLAMHTPLKRDQYDLCIIDEASQIWMSHAIGALYRSKSVLIAGDDKQMQPVQFFQANKGEETLLQRAKYILSSQKLKHHYRSQHSDLIQFSNNHFYNNELHVFPAFKTEKAINHYYIEGEFENRQNEIEAKQVVEILIELINKNTDQASIGIVAFSQSQVECIFNMIPEKHKDQIIEKITNNKIFLLPLEKIQGDECEHLIVSTTYAKDQSGKLHQRFGLLSLNGGINRLNVLATRASRTIDVISSMKSDEIHISTNHNTEMYKKWLRYIEEKSEIEVIHQKSKTKNIEINELKNFREIVIQTIVNTKRGWKINYK